MSSEGHQSSLRILREVTIKVEELNERDSRKAMREQFGQDDGFADSELDSSNWSVLDEQEVKPSRVARHIKRAWR